MVSSVIDLLLFNIEAATVVTLLVESYPFVLQCTVNTFPPRVMHDKLGWVHFNDLCMHVLMVIISSISGCLIFTAVAEEVLNFCTMKEPDTDETDCYFTVAFNYEFIEDIQDKYVT